jgi:serine/threonine protein phosphatase PrpC
MTQDESLNHSLPALARKPQNLSSLVNFNVRKNSEPRFDHGSKLKHIMPAMPDSKMLLSPTRVFPHKRLPVLSAGKKNFTVISKSKSSSEFTPLMSSTVKDEPITPAKEAETKNPVPEKKKDSLVNQTFKEYYFQTMPGFSDGKTKTNQDTFYVNMSVQNSTQCSLYAVFDGHGPLGHKVSEFLKRNLNGTTALLESFQKRFDPETVYELDEYTGILEAVCVDINSKLIANRLINSFFSGSTGIIVLLHRDVISCANVGDSRAALFKTAENGEISIYKLSTDHTPADPKEKERVVKAGGKVHPCIGSIRLKPDSLGNYIGPPRIWDQTGEGPGLMMSRSFGDRTGHSVGMICVPGRHLLHQRCIR